MRYGYKASAEQFGPSELLRLSVLAEQLGFESVAVSDHLQPWRHTGGHSPAALVWLGALGQRTTSALIGTSVLTPTMRYHPVVVAQAFATLGCLHPGRVFLGVGTGEALNERPLTGGDWPGAKERRQRLAEAVELMRRLRTEKATIYDRPDDPVPVLIAASGPLAAKLAGRAGDGFICTSGKAPELYEQLLAKVDEGDAERYRDRSAFERMIEIKVSYDRDGRHALEACRPWAALSLSSEEKIGVEDPIEMERLADAAADRAHSRFIVSADPAEVAERIAGYADLGFEHLVFHGPGEDQERFLRQFAEDVLPLLPR